jgi:hypothetical protein
LLLTGCGGPAATVSGTITLDGKPFMTSAAKGSVNFISSDGAMAQAPLDSSGHYNLAIGKETGTKPGQYKVVVVATELPLRDPMQPSMVPIPKVLTPERYGASATSDLTADVKNGSNVLNFDLKSTP